MALLSLSLYPSLHACLLPPNFSLPLRPSSRVPCTRYARSSVSPSPLKSVSRSHTAFRPLRLAKPPTPPRQMQRRSPALQLQRAGARFSSRHSRRAQALLRGASYAPENMRRDPAKGERINRSLCSGALPAAVFFPFLPTVPYLLGIFPNFFFAPFLPPPLFHSLSQRDSSRSRGPLAVWLRSRGLHTARDTRYGTGGG